MLLLLLLLLLLVMVVVVFLLDFPFSTWNIPDPLLESSGGGR